MSSSFTGSTKVRQLMKAPKRHLAEAGLPARSEVKNDQFGELLWAASESEDQTLFGSNV